MESILVDGEIYSVGMQVVPNGFYVEGTPKDCIKACEKYEGHIGIIEEIYMPNPASREAPWRREIHFSVAKIRTPVDSDYPEGEYYNGGPASYSYREIDIYKPADEDIQIFD